MVLTSMEITEGEVSTISFEFTVYGPLSLDAVVVIAAR
jgi:5-methylthioribose kinase